MLLTLRRLQLRLWLRLRLGLRLGLGLGQALPPQWPNRPRLRLPRKTQ
jgi:hypothetical protein